jgi:hypothetical protein
MLYSILADTSVSLDFSSLISTAFQIVNQVFPLFVVPIGFMLGFAMLGWIIAEVRKAIPHG